MSVTPVSRLFSPIVLVVWAVVAAGIVLRLRAYLEGRSLWLDESFLALFFIDRSLGGSVSLPLPSNQSAPPGFLLLTEISVNFFGFNEFALRVYPLLASIGTLVVVAILGSRLLKSPFAQALLVSSAAFSPVLIYYATELKQYSSDVFAVTVVLLLASFPKFREAPTAFTYLFIAVTSLPGLLAVVVLEFTRIASGASQKESTILKQLLDSWLRIIAILLGGAMHAIHIIFVNNVSQTEQVMTRFWSNAGGLPPLRFVELSDYLWYSKALANTVAEPFVGQAVSGPRVAVDQIWLWMIPIAVAIVGFVISRGQKTDLAIRVSLILIVLAFALASAQLYPLGGRLSLYLIPATLLLFAFGLDRVLAHWPEFRRLLATVLSFSVLLTPLAISSKNFLSPIDSRDTAWALVEIQNRTGNSTPLLVDGPNRNQVIVHQEFGYGSELAFEEISIADSADGSSWVPSADSYWMISTHRQNEAKEIAENLSSRGFAITCRFEQDVTLILKLDRNPSREVDCDFRRD